MSSDNVTYVMGAVTDQMALLLPLAAGLIALMWGVPKAFRLVKRIAK